jgi:hypothetical protein
MKNLHALPAAALAIIFAIAALPQATQAQSPSAATAERSMSRSKLPVRVVASMADSTAPSLPDSRSKTAEVTPPRPISASPQAYDLNWLQGGGG